MSVDNGFPKDMEFIEVKEKYNFNDSVYTVLDLNYFSKLLSPSFPNLYREWSTYDRFKENTVVVEFVNSRRNSITKEQMIAFQQFVLNEKEIAGAVRKGIYEYYKSSYQDYFHGATLYSGYSPDIEEWLPKIVNGNELDDKTRLSLIMIYPPQNGITKVGLSLIFPRKSGHIKELVLG